MASEYRETYRFWKAFYDGLRGLEDEWSPQYDLRFRLKQAKIEKNVIDIRVFRALSKLKYFRIVPKTPKLFHFPRCCHHTDGSITDRGRVTNG